MVNLITEVIIQKTKFPDIENQCLIFFGAAYNISNLCVIGNTMTTVPNNRLYPFRLWLLTTIIVGPILLGLGSALYDTNHFNNSTNLGVVFLFIPFGLAFSLPTLMVVWFAHSLLAGKLSPSLLKWLLVFLAVVGVFITFSLIGGSMARTYTLFYAAAVIVSGLILQGWKS